MYGIKYAFKLHRWKLPTNLSIDKAFKSYEKALAKNLWKRKNKGLAILIENFDGDSFLFWQGAFTLPSLVI